MLRPPPNSTLFPYRTLFRSASQHHAERDEPAAQFVAHQLPGKEPVSHGVQHPPVGGKNRDSPHHRPDFSFELSSVVDDVPVIDRKSTRLNSSHLVISYAVFC